ncbi:MAG: MmgE/PrpD family protein [Ferrimicrobium sp.]
MRAEKSVSQVLADFVAGLDFNSIPDEVRNAAALQIMDTVGVALAGRSAVPDAPFLRLAEPRGVKGEAIAWGSSDLIDIGSALVVNAALCHSLDFDNTHTESMVHVGAAVLPLCLTLGSVVSAPGAEVLRAYIAGVESAARIGGASSGGFHAQGFHATSVVGVFAAVVAGAAILQLSSEITVNALGLAGSMAGGLLEYHSTGSSNKQLHPGMAAAQAYLALRLAISGCDAPSSIFEGRFGFYKTYLGEVPSFFGLDTLGSNWEVLKVTTKPWPACNLVHPALEVLERLQLENDFEADDVLEVTVTVPSEIIPLVLEPVEAKLEPRTAYEAKFSLQYCVARQLLDRQVSVLTFSQKILQDDAVVALAKRVSYNGVTWPGYPRLLGSEVVVSLADGRRLSGVVHSSLGSFENPMSRADMIAKFNRNTVDHLGVEIGREVAEELADIALCPDVSTLITKLAGHE